MIIINAIKICIVTLNLKANMSKKKKQESARHFLAPKRDILMKSFLSLKKNLKLGCILLTLKKQPYATLPDKNLM
jgi:hypothetical protein